jgi:hypothetical protein
MAVILLLPGLDTDQYIFFLIFFLNLSFFSQPAAVTGTSSAPTGIQSSSGLRVSLSHAATKRLSSEEIETLYAGAVQVRGSIFFIYIFFWNFLFFYFPTH